MMTVLRVRSVLATPPTLRKEEFWVWRARENHDEDIVH